MFYNNAKIEKYDLIVVGNNLAAVFSASMAAKSGKSVALVSESELLFSEFSETMIGFVKPETFLFSILENMGIEPVFNGDEYSVPPGMAAKAALKYLRDRGVNIYLKVAPIGLVKNGRLVCGIAVATKFGSFVIRGNALANFSDRLYFAAPSKEEREYIFSFQMGGVSMPLLENEYDSIKEAYDITFHNDIHADDTCNVVFKAKNRLKSGVTQHLILLAADICGHLIKKHPAFKKACMQKYALRPLSTQGEEVSLAPNFLHFDMGDIGAEEYFFDFEEANAKVLALLSFENTLTPDTLQMTYGSFELEPLYTGEELDEFLGAEVLKINLPTQNIPTVQSDLFIAGLGAGGAAALQSALKSGCSIVAAEAMPSPGGTRTHGMVSAFWHGYTGGFAKDNLGRIAEYAKENIGEKAPLFIAEAIYNLLVSRECQAYYSSIVFGAVKNGDDTAGALIATEGGVIRVLATKSIDATGDADLAVLSDNEYMPNGDRRDFVTQGYSIWGLEKKGVPFQESVYKNDDDSISTEKYTEYLRGIFITQPGQSDFGFSPLLTVRESRRIKGKYVIKMEDILRQSLFEDTIAVSLCLYDAHGVGSSPAYYTSVFGGIIGKGTPDICTRIPLRALLPERDNGLMVVSKAISATRDAGCLIRMNPDIQNTAYAAGMVAGYAAKNGLDFEAAYTEEIKNRLREQGLLPDFYNKAPAATAKILLEGIFAGNKQAIIAATAHNEFLPEFETAYNGEPNLAVVLAALGSHKVFDDMLAQLKAASDEYEYNKKGANTIKTYGVLLSRLAAENKNERSALLPVLARAIDVMDAGGEHIDPQRGIYQNSKVSNRIVPNFKALLGLAMAAETVADKSLAASLTALSKKKNIRLSDGDEIHSVQLYLRIIAAAARCGDADSLNELKGYLSSERLFFRSFAKKELSAISSFGGVYPVKAEEFWV